MGIKVENLTKRFNGFTAVNSVSFSVADGEFVSLLGPSGSGKSTTLRSIAGLENPDAGRIEIDGTEVTHQPAEERGIGFVFQHFALFRHMNVRDNVAFGLRVRGVARKERAKIASEYVERFGLDGYENRMPHQLSGGQRQRVALARALAAEPKLLLLDEPFGALDARLRKELRTWLRNLHDKSGLTTLLVTHDQEEAMEVSDRVIVMNHGRIEQDASPREVYHHPATPFVATFVGEVNRLDAIVKSGKAEWGPLRFDAPEHKENAKVQVIFRPSDVYVANEAADNRVPAVIRETQFFGAFEALRLDVGGGQLFTAHVPTWAARERNLIEGEAVHVFVTSQPRIFVSVPGVEKSSTAGNRASMKYQP